MTKQTNRETSYGNWVSTKLLLVTGLLSCIFFGLSFLHISLIIPAILLLAAFFYFVYAYYLFSPAGANLQNRIRDLVLDHLAWDGRGEGLDVGCGNGPLVIKIAKKYPNCRVTGIDNWSKAWDYSQAECEKNARLEHVMQQVV